MKRRQRRRGRASTGSGQGWIATLFEGLLDGLIDFLLSWGRR
ncbi:hypothetical protein ACFWCA_19275 [Streptomyces phaeochromogenes]